ncbi:uncharacterized protein EKO05_0002800 [Ascochyta rabiei]|uniref:SnoaL-like domain-containing protein n=1 Tax=Didymella rabiei TaxID=5454 RepID=A0A162YNR1_DIDRA|nr:uncharacterized protein EKO05_0002800 [Ascochyta rabiei]KZM20138.1 hypothetical protein ST47_g8700 [Ascochyta rabiei]KZM23670.1 hypothetical protein ST47_g5185 [Ascochyta rabiei]UPX12244.1 hypothetical protein EKO05_0002800 [Ascochyta rabiei]
MTDYDFSTRAGFQLAMKNALTTSSPEETEKYAEATVTSSFYHTFNGQRLERDAWYQSLENWRGKITHYDPNVEEFLRDGSQLAARMTGVVQLDGTETFFESFFFATVDEESGKLASLTERAVWGAVGKGEVHGTA